ncbi:MAG: hypothetical protein GY954_09640 [Alteromonas sp.]|nr:hypothetical protein [Alteromonas sp.]
MNSEIEKYMREKMLEAMKNPSFTDYTDTNGLLHKVTFLGPNSPSSSTITKREDNVLHVDFI